MNVLNIEIRFSLGKTFLLVKPMKGNSIHCDFF